MGEQLLLDRSADHHDKGGALFVLRSDAAPGLNGPIGDGRIIDGHRLNIGGPVLAAELHLAHLPHQIGDQSDGRRLAADRLRVGDGQRRGAAKAGPRAAGQHGARKNNSEIGAETLDLLAHRRVRAIAHRHHRDQRGDADEHAEHGQRRAQLVASDRLYRGGDDHRREGQRRNAGRASRRAVSRMKDQRRRRCLRRARGLDGRRRGGRLAPVVGNDPAVAHGDDPARIFGDIGFMRDDDDRHALIAVERDQRLHDLMRGLGVEIAGGFVREQDARAVDQRPGDGDALLLAARNCAGVFFSRSASPSSFSAERALSSR